MVAPPAVFAGVVAADVTTLADAGMVTVGVAGLADAGIAFPAECNCLAIGQCREVWLIWPMLERRSQLTLLLLM